MTSFELAKLVARLSEYRFKTIRYSCGGNVSWTAKKGVLRVLADYYPNVWPSVATIAKQAGLGERQTQKALTALEVEGYIAALSSKKGGRSGTTQYRINIEQIVNPSMDSLDWKRIAEKLYPLTVNLLGWILEPYGQPNGPQGPPKWLDEVWWV